MDNTNETNHTTRPNRDGDPGANDRGANDRGAGTIKAAFFFVLVGVLGIIALSWLGPSFLRNPFTTNEVNRQTPAVLQELRDLSEFRAAQVQLEVTVDHEDDVRYVPSVIAGERAQYIAVGTVDAIVDFSTLETTAITVEDGHMTISLPEPTLSEPLIDMDLSRTMNRDRGILNRVGGLFSDSPTSEQDLIEIASDELAAAALETDILNQAREQTESMLQAMAAGMGYESVTVVFLPAEAAPTAN